jgi:hypothetical protein
MVCLPTKNDRLAKWSKKLFVIRHDIKNITQSHNNKHSHTEIDWYLFGDYIINHEDLILTGG